MTWLIRIIAEAIITWLVFETLKDIRKGGNSNEKICNEDLVSD